jgi:redox-sensitive bicupin YhaK (pirin superfamily)
MDPFLFCVYHKDVYPPATNDFMTAPVRGDGSDFNPNAPYRMYHGDTIPGFPQHPHRGFETITATITGLVDHADSVGNAGRYGHGDVQWMTAGGGVVHSEMFPLLEKEKPNALRFFQIWLNLPAKSKMVDPSFAMFWAHDVHKYESMERQAKVTVWAGNYFGVNGMLYVSMLMMCCVVGIHADSRFRFPIFSYTAFRSHVGHIKSKPKTPHHPIAGRATQPTMSPSFILASNQVVV